MAAALPPQEASASASASVPHVISNPVLADIEKRWEEMPPQEQADLWMALRDRMKADWHEMTWQEKKAGVYLRSLWHDRLTIRVKLYSFTYGTPG